MASLNHYLRAYEVGRPPAVVKYEVAVKVRTNKSGPVIRNRIRLPFPVKTDTRIGVICSEDSPLMVEAQQLGAVAVGEESLFESIRQGNIPFNKLICHVDSQDALRKANLGKILGPKGLMPSQKTKTITSDLKATVQELIGADEYKERAGVNHPKALDEVVLSSTNGPGFSLNGSFHPTDPALKPEHLQSVM
ncbi:hypothetical protein NEMBOFW57_005525 [Staphylotrichum longicolle]|uniref:Ribosomal protein L1 n=1 Tax=Staphylotrichum longicolle TaxID=669026 RepID=A0AAD4F0H0_9PEZI|nr:hypothetical protein NEMBOFW57_005525 [Staphylotrichum longicolle]